MGDKLGAWGESIFSVMTAEANRYNALNLAQGFPDFPVAPELIALVNEAMRQGYNQYARPVGNAELSRAVQMVVHENYGYSLDPEQQLTIVPGATFGIYVTMQALINAGDEVIYFEPGYDSYAPSITMAGGVPVPLRCEAPLFRIPWEKLEQCISPKTRAILINHPHNPTGTLLSVQELEKLCALAVRHDLLVISDEVYEFIHFSAEKHRPAYTFPDIADRCVVISSFGKTLHATGWKCGYIVASAALTKLIRKVNQFASFSTHHPTQVGIARYLEKYSFRPEIAADYLQRYQYFKSLMDDARFEMLDCKGTYFLLLDYAAISDAGSKEYALRLIREYGIATIPLAAFYNDGYDPKLLRICFAKEYNTLQKAAEVLCRI